MTGEEIKKAMRKLSPVEFEGIKYKRISAYIFRVIENPRGGYKEILQVELLDRNGGSVVIAPIDKVNLYEV